MTSRKTAIVLFNLGGPDRLEAVKPFLFNLFHDPAIISVPQPMRWFLAKLISSRREKTAQEIYAEIGNKSPILENTQAQARALEAQINGMTDQPLGEVRCFITMRYWHPMSDETAAKVRDWGADEVILLPLYPQFSTTTTGSSYQDWMRAAHKAGLKAPTRLTCCYPKEPGFVAAVADKIHKKLAELEPGQSNNLRILFSAHGLPKKVIEKGDPYQEQVETTVASVVNYMAEKAIGPKELDYQVCYQSRVGPLEWIGPSTEDEIARAGQDDVGLVVVPIAFVSEHSETLVELDIEYAELARENGVGTYLRVGTVDNHDDFIGGLAGLALDASNWENGRVDCQKGGYCCGNQWSGCIRNS
ncbi:ferrochelatase [Aestuariispira insulae]|uniref:Ferrochelatase n=1 Tax=Aestuariispira insulae TaxID=1461337 RepID=A0A3D9HPD2_9PROT|nr:ferrochelatase [Aestuariispira insulae]RED51364.1 ferrochelatase [Aestuariispira insulae]